MRTLRHKLVATPLLIGMALIAIGLPASAREVYRENISHACCTAHNLSAREDKDSYNGVAAPTCSRGDRPGAEGLGCCP
jgi:hypothetical protein